MDIEEVNQVLEELKKTRPEKLNAEAKRLFEAIMKIADERDVALSELDKKDKIINEMARLFSKISKGEYVTIEKNTEIDKVIEYFTKKVEG